MRAEIRPLCQIFDGSPTHEALCRASDTALDTCMPETGRRTFSEHGSMTPHVCSPGDGLEITITVILGKRITITSRKVQLDRVSWRMIFS